MEALEAAASLARVLLAISETGRDCDLLVMQRTRSARLSLTRGKLVALAGLELEPIGDTLRSLGMVLTPPDDERAASHEPIGARLVAEGAVSRTTVRRAVQVQLSRGTDALLRGSSARVELAPRTRSVGIEAAIDFTSALWCALLTSTQSLPLAVLERLAPATELTLTRAGERRVGGLLAALACGELARAYELRGVSARERESVLGQLPRSRAALRSWLAPQPVVEHRPLRAVLFALGAVAERSEQDRGYSLLLRKRRELSRNASPSALLDLPEAACREHVRHAFKRLAHQLHPDRFHTRDARIQAISTEVMGALVRAEKSLSASRQV